MENWIPLISTCIGGLIATVPLLFGIAVQLIMHASEKRQKEKEAKIQSREKWIERDILKIMDLTPQILILFTNWKSIDYQVTLLEGRLATGRGKAKDIDPQVQSLAIKAPLQFGEAMGLFNTIGELVSSFEEPAIIDAYNAFAESRPKNLQMANDEMEEKKEGAVWEKFIVNAGKFRRVLRDKLISLRE
jgi:hypothetical protein